MRRKGAACAAALAVALLSCPALARELTGEARVIDGDTLEIAGERVRLYGIDAQEAAQSCTGADGRVWPCGAAAGEALRALTQGREVICVVTGRDRYKRFLALCHAGGEDLGARLVRDGMALAYRRYSRIYAALEAEAHDAGRGIWAGRFEMPELWRHRGRQ
ncbi:thermonuclease family protein [Tistrella sp. BH-R2-4]|uniref:Thermonuclease family protein n=1 Tax=Tistrella arctica TaxID=3133430 RepID=A0ABU9YSN1_9PROT